MPSGKQEVLYRKTFDLGGRTLEHIKIIMEFYDEPTEVGAVRRSLQNVATLIGLVAHSGQLFLEQEGKAERILLFERAKPPMPIENSDAGNAASAGDL